MQYVYSQENTDENETDFKACIFLNVNLSEHESSDYETIISEILSVELANIGFTVLESDNWRNIAEQKGLNNNDLLISRNAISVAAETGADIAITGFYYIEESAIIIDFKCYSIKNNRLIASHIDSSRIGLSVHNLIYTAVEDMLPKILAAKEDIGGISQEEEEILTDFSKYELTFLSEDEDMEIYILENTFLGNIKDGRLIINTIPFNIGTEINITKKKAGYHSETEIIRIEENNQKITLKPLKKETRFAAEIIWTTGQFFGLGLGMRYYFIPDSFFISADDYFYIQYGFNERSSPVFHDDLRVLAGKYLFFPYSSLFRMGISAGIGCIFSFYSIPDKGLFTDFYIDFSNIWTEWNIKNWAIFLRVELKYSLGIGNNLLGRQIIVPEGIGPSVSLGAVRKW